MSKFLKFSEWLKMKKSSFKQSKPAGVRNMEDDLSDDFKGHLEKLGTIEPFKIKEGMNYAFSTGDKVKGEVDFRIKHGEVTSVVPGRGPGEEWYFVVWDDGTSDRYQIRGAAGCNLQPD